MMILHLVNKPAVFSECIAHLANGDCVALIEAAASTDAAELFHVQQSTGGTKNITIYRIESPDDMQQLVTLTTTAEKVVSWY